MPSFENIFMKLNQNHLVIIVIVILLMLLYLYNTSKTQVITPSVQPKNNITIPNLNNKAEFTVYYTNWCGWSKRALTMLNSPEMNDFFNGNSKCKLTLIDCESKDGKQICEVNNINGFPTMKLINGNTKINYNGDRTPSAIKEFINKNV